MNQKQREHFCKQAGRHRQQIKNQLRSHFRKISPPVFYSGDIDRTQSNKELKLNVLDPKTQREIKECWAAYDKLSKKWNKLMKETNDQSAKCLKQEAAASSKLSKIVNAVVSKIQLCNDADEIESLMNQLPSMVGVIE